VANCCRRHFGCIAYRTVGIRSPWRALIAIGQFRPYAFKALHEID
jgi:hypothetical protein